MVLDIVKLLQHLLHELYADKLSGLSVDQEGGCLICLLRADKITRGNIAKLFITGKFRLWNINIFELQQLA